MTSPEPAPAPPPPARTLERAKKVWSLVSRRHKASLFAATGLMGVTAALGSAVAVLLGGLVSTMQGTRPEGVAAWVLPLVKRSGDLRLEPRGALDAQGRPIAQVLSQDQLFDVAVVFLAVIALAYLLREALLVARRYLVQSTATQIEKDTFCSLVGHLLKIDLTTLSGERVGALHGRIHRSVEGFVRFVKLAFQDLFPALLNGGFALVTCIVLQPAMGGVMALVIPVTLLITLRQVRSQKGVRIDLMRSKEGLDGTVVEQLGGIEYIRAADTHDQEAARVEQAAEQRRKKQLGHQMAMAVFDSVKSLNEGLFHVAVIAYAIYLAAKGSIPFGDVLTFSMLFQGVMQPLRDVHRIVDDAHESSLQVGDLMGLLETPVDRSFGQVTLRQPAFTAGQPAIACDGLTVDYVGRDGKPKRGLDGVSVVIRHGETIGAAGPSGSGKSTWIKALMRLIHPSGGHAVLGGVALGSLSRESIGALFGYVSQIPFVFAGTVRENIAYGTPGATPERIEEAAKRAHIHDEILALPNGYDSLLSERGQNLSGGQRQRIALARIFLKNPPILILDEGTSALDNISERAVQRALTAARQDRTTVLVAHRLSTLREADRILVFDKAKIAEEGTYDDLVAKGGVFAELVRSAGEGA